MLSDLFDGVLRAIPVLMAMLLIYFMYWMSRHRLSESEHRVRDYLKLVWWAAVAVVVIASITYAGSRGWTREDDDFSETCEDRGDCRPMPELIGFVAMIVGTGLAIGISKIDEKPWPPEKASDGEDSDF